MKQHNDVTAEVIGLYFDVEKKAKASHTNAVCMAEANNGMTEEERKTGSCLAAGRADAYGAIAIRLAEILTGVEGIDLSIIRAHRSTLRDVGKVGE